MIPFRIVKDTNTYQGWGDRIAITHLLCEFETISIVLQRFSIATLVSVYSTEAVEYGGHPKLVAHLLANLQGPLIILEGSREVTLRGINITDVVHSRCNENLVAHFL